MKIMYATDAGAKWTLQVIAECALNVNRIIHFARIAVIVIIIMMIKAIVEIANTK